LSSSFLLEEDLVFLLPVIVKWSSHCLASSCVSQKKARSLSLLLKRCTFLTQFVWHGKQCKLQHHVTLVLAHSALAWQQNCYCSHFWWRCLSSLVMADMQPRRYNVKHNMCHLTCAFVSWHS
jgi:hypothetical protein